MGRTLRGSKAKEIWRIRALDHIVHERKGVIWVYGPIRTSRAGTTISCFLRTVAFVMVCLVWHSRASGIKNTGFSCPNLAARVVPDSIYRSTTAIRSVRVSGWRRYMKKWSGIGEMVKLETGIIGDSLWLHPTTLSLDNIIAALEAAPLINTQRKG